MTERRVRPKNPEQALKAHLPWIPATAEPADITAIQACYHGTANEEQQRRALDYIINLSLNDGMLYFAGEEGRRNTDFALGRAYVGNQIITFIKLRRPNSEQG